MSGEVEPLTRESTLEGQVAQETVGTRAVAFPPQRGWGTHGSIRKCPGKRRKGSCARAERGVHGRGVWKPWKTTGSNYVQHSAVHKVNSKRGTIKCQKNPES